MLPLNSARSAGGSCFFPSLILLANVIQPSKQFSGPHPWDGAMERHGAQHDRHDWRGSVHYHASGLERDGRAAGTAGMDFGSATCRLRWLGVCGIGRGAAHVRRILSLLARNLWSAEMGTANFVSVYLASILQRAAFDCDRMHRAGGVRRLLLARAGDGLCPARCGAADPVGRSPAGQLDRYARHIDSGGDLFLHGAAAVSEYHGDWAAYQGVMVRGDGDHWLDHLRRPDPLQCRPSV